MPRQATAVAAGKHLVQHVVQPRRDDEFVQLDGRFQAILFAALQNSPG